MIASAANAGQIAVMDYVYKNIAIILTDSENHRTATQYEDALIAKVRQRTATGRCVLGRRCGVKVVPLFCGGVAWW